MGQLQEKSSRAHRASRGRAQRGHTLAEVAISMGLSAMVAAAFFQSYTSMSRTILQEVTVSQYQDTIRQAVYQFGKDLRLAGANPTGNPDLFDGVPTDDVALDLDPDGDGDLTNALLIRSDRYGTVDGQADGDHDDTLEAVMYHHEVDTARLMRHTWRVLPHDVGSSAVDHQQHIADYDVTPFIEGICSFKLTYTDKQDQPTEDPSKVASVLMQITSASGPAKCFERESFTRETNVLIRIRNR